MSVLARKVMSANVPWGAAADVVDSQWVAQIRAQRQAIDARLERWLTRRVPIEVLVRYRARCIDQWIQAAWQRCQPIPDSAAIFALGGYGREEVFPYSDIDLCILIDPGSVPASHPAIERLIPLLWDCGLPISHTVLSLEQCRAWVATDSCAMTALLEARPIVASPQQIQHVTHPLSLPDVWPARTFFDCKVQERQRRYQQLTDLADQLEPNVKDGPGGLRDLHTLRWLALRLMGTADLRRLQGAGHLSLEEVRALRQHWRQLARLRYGLHCVAQRPEERLRFAQQQALAQYLEPARSATCNASVEALMQQFYRHQAGVQQLTECLLQRMSEWMLDTPATQAMNGYLLSCRGYLQATNTRWPDHDMVQVFTLFMTWVAEPTVRGLHSLTVQRLTQVLPELPSYQQAPLIARTAFMQLLRSPHAITCLLQLARFGVLGRWIPAFDQVTGRMPFDLFHAYTIDQHTLTVLRFFAVFAGMPADPRFPTASRVWPLLPKPELLILAGLLHDLGKGSGKDHSIQGAQEALRFCQAHALDESESQLVSWLVRMHLQLSQVAQTQDTSDPQILRRFASLVGDSQRLHYLLVLTCADVAATNPHVWNSWKERLFADLYYATLRMLQSDLISPRFCQAQRRRTWMNVQELLRQQGWGVAERAQHISRIPIDCFQRFRPDQLVWWLQLLGQTAIGQPVVATRQVGPEPKGVIEIFVYSPDRDGLLAAIVMTLDRIGLDIHRARALNGPGSMVLDFFEVLPNSQQTTLQSSQITTLLLQMLAKDLLEITASVRLMPSRLRHFQVAQDLQFTDLAERARTTMSLRAPNVPGLLAAVCQILRNQRLRVHEAMVASFGERAEDLFQITDLHDACLDDGAKQRIQAEVQAFFALQ